MDTDEKILDLLFRRIPPERLLRQACQWARGDLSPQQEDDRKQVFQEFADATLRGYSGDEQALIYAQLDQAVHGRAKELHIRRSVFLPLVDFGLEVLTDRGNEPLCRSSRILRWRDAYHLFGQDIIVCAYLAYHDIRFRTHRTDFAWPAVLRTDDDILRQFLSPGIAENHFHLNGSTQSFALGWCRLMNEPEAIAELDPDFSRLLQSVAIRGPEDNVLPVRDRVVAAALVRSILFRTLHPGMFATPERSDPEDPEPQREASFCSQEAFRKEYLSSFSSIAVLTRQTRVLQESLGVWIPLPDGGSVCLDYALEFPVFLVVKDSPYRVLAGERYFLYRCFTACFRGELSPFEELLLYLYLSLKTAFRGEMIQVNRQVGFKNFADYESRKDLAWRGPNHWEACRVALNAPLRTEPVRFLEARLTPVRTSREMIQKILRYDRGKRFADQPFRPLPLPEHTHFDPERAAEKFLEEPYFYVLHFPKRPDDEQKKEFSLQCRHQALRQEALETAEALAKALSTSPYLCSRVRGIDGCANEVGCRPEVFATAFRFLRGFQSTELWRPDPLLPRTGHRLSVTYHAGEDFYDIANGLRAIDEALYFLDYRRGERIGHALALGVDPQVHYRKKSMSIVLPKQDRLDDLVWLLFRGRELGVSIDPQQYAIMHQEALRLLREIYGGAMDRNGWSITLQDYFCSMLLRGDDPSLYRGQTFRGSEEMNGSQYDCWRITPGRPSQALETYRRSRKIAGMYYYYHYGWSEKREGGRPIRVPIQPGYMALIRQVQDALQQHLAARGIVIECNLSSNVLIGTFDDYAKHPIVRFNNMGLSQQPDERCPQLHMCINTDDLGVFDTSLEFEYALLYRALSDRRDEDGHPVYTGKNILNYLRNIRKMGMQAVFPPAGRAGGLR